MKRLLKTVLSLVLCAVMLTGIAVPAHAALAPMRIGDVDFDCEISIADATVIQRYLAELGAKPDWYTEELFLAICDADGDGDVTILDATAIQRYLAELPSAFDGRDDNSLVIWDYYVGDSAHHSTAEIRSVGVPGGTKNQIAYAGVPVDFTVEVKWGAKPRLFTFGIDGETIEEVKADGVRKHTFTRTFTEPGEYQVTTRAECAYGAATASTRKIEVRPLPEDGRPVIMGATFFDMSQMMSGNGVLTVTAAGGTAPYEYCYTVCDGGEYLEEPASQTPGKGTVIIDYVPDNEINVLAATGRTQSFYPMGTDICVQITVRDAEGRVSDPVVVSYQSYELVA